MSESNDPLADNTENPLFQALDAELNQTPAGQDFATRPSSDFYGAPDRLIEGKEPSGEDFRNRIKAIVGEVSPDRPDSQFIQTRHRGDNGKELTTRLWLPPEPKATDIGTAVAVIQNKSIPEPGESYVNSGYVIFDNGKVWVRTAIGSSVQGAPPLTEQGFWLGRAARIELYNGLAEF